MVAREKQKERERETTQDATWREKRGLVLFSDLQQHIDTSEMTSYKFLLSPPPLPPRQKKRVQLLFLRRERNGGRGFGAHDDVSPARRVCRKQCFRCVSSGKTLSRETIVTYHRKRKNTGVFIEWSALLSRRKVSRRLSRILPRNVISQFPTFIYELRRGIEGWGGGGVVTGPAMGDAWNSVRSRSSSHNLNCFVKIPPPLVNNPIISIG